MADRREQLKMTQAQLAEKADLSPSFISDIETGLKSLRAENLMKLSQALEISSDYLLTGQRTDQDIHRVSEILQQFQTDELLCAEEILKKILAVCKAEEKDKS